MATVEGGTMTGDLLALAEKKASNKKVNTEGFIDAYRRYTYKKTQWLKALKIHCPIYWILL